MCSLKNLVYCVRELSPFPFLSARFLAFNHRDAQESSISFWLLAQDNWKLRVGLRTSDDFKSGYWPLWNQKGTTSILGAWYYYTISIPGTIKE